MLLENTKAAKDGEATLVEWLYLHR